MQIDPSALPAVDAVTVIPRGGSEVTCEGEAAQAIASAWRRLENGRQARCHVPPFGFRFLSHGEVMLEATVCWRCNNIHGRRAGEPVLITFDSKCEAATELLHLAEQAAARR